MGQNSSRELGFHEYKPGEESSNTFSTDNLSFDWKIQHGTGVVTVSINTEMDVLTFVFQGFKGQSTFKYNILVGALDPSQANGMTGGIKSQVGFKTVLSFLQSKELTVTGTVDLNWEGLVNWSSFTGDKPVTVIVIIAPDLSQTTTSLNDKL